MYTNTDHNITIRFKLTQKDKNVYKYKNKKVPGNIALTLAFGSSNLCSQSCQGVSYRRSPVVIKVYITLFRKLPRAYIISGSLFDISALN